MVVAIPVSYLKVEVEGVKVPVLTKGVPAPFRIQVLEPAFRV